MNIERITVPVVRPVAMGNIRAQYVIQEASWITHPQARADQNSLCRYELRLTLATETTFIIHVSADQRFELFCDGDFVGMGPDRSDCERWSFHAYQLSLAAGDHCLEADVHYLHQGAPAAQVSLRPAFILASENCPTALHTGTAPWRVRQLEGVQVTPPAVKGYHVVGPQYIIDGDAYFRETAWEAAVAIAGPIAPASNTNTGLVATGWKLFPSRLPEQLRLPWRGGRIRAVGQPDPYGLVTETDATSNAAWQALVEGNAPLVVPAHSRVAILWDLEAYISAYPELTLSGGREARVQMLWAESCYEKSDPPMNSSVKGNRDVVDGKCFQGFGDTFVADGHAERVFRPCWWRAGRYVRILVETAEAPLTLSGIRLLETRFPVENDGVFESDDAALEDVIRIAVRGIQMCAHETYMDCPYYEQMMYVGDTRLQMLTAYVMSGEDRLNQRGIELFDWSRHENGFVLERHPSMPRQVSPTFSMIWVLMLRDHAWWRDDAELVRGSLKGLRCMLEEFKEHQGTAPLLTALPGWTFMDWVPEWSCGYPPAAELGTSSVVNLLFLDALLAAAQLEEAYGEAHLAAYNREWARRLAHAIRETFWDDTRGLFADDPDHAHWSEHAQCLALLSGAFPELETRCLTQLIDAPKLARTTVYFSFYLFEVLARFGRGDLLYRKLDFWKALAAQGFKTPVESPEPSRSDCHGWGSHPLFHMHASLAGIRPAAPGFATVRIAPQPGGLTQLHSCLPHPRGTVSLTMVRDGASWKIAVSLPPGVRGALVWGDQEWPLADQQELTVDASR